MMEALKYWGIYALMIAVIWGGRGFLFGSRERL